MSMLLSVVGGQGGITVPGAPGTLSLSAGSPSHTVIDLSWSAPSDTGGGTVSGYRIQYKTTGSWSNVVSDTGSTSTTYSVTGLTASTTYYFRVAAINEKGVGAYGNEPSLATAADPAVQWSATGGYTSGTSGSYSWVRFTSSGSFTITSNTTGKTFTQYIVAGGGGGAGGDDFGNGAGGGGGARELTGQSMSNSTHTITIGAGGTGSTYNNAASSGSSSSIGATSNVGGGGGNSGSTGGSGGGGGSQATNHVPGSGTSGQGYRGGYGFTGGWPNYAGGGGGGGAGAMGETTSSWSGSGRGGIGSTTTLGYLVAGGGGAGYYSSAGWDAWAKGGDTSNTGTGGEGDDNQAWGAGNGARGGATGGHGGANTGGGGGSHIRYPPFNAGGTGGSGVVEIRWTT